MSTSSLLIDLEHRGIILVKDGDNFRCRAPKALLTPELRQVLAFHKGEILRHLEDRQSPKSPAQSEEGPFYYGASGWFADYRLVSSPEFFRVFHNNLLSQKRFAFDLETTSLDTNQARIVGLSFCWKEGEAWYLPLLAPSGEPCLDYEATLKSLRSVLEDPNVAKVNQNIKYDLLVFRRHGIRVQGVSGDSMVADYLLRPGKGDHNQDAQALRYLNYRTIPISDLIGKGKNQLRMDSVPLGKISVYAGEDADIALRVTNLLETKLSHHNLKSLYDDVEIPLIDILTDMEATGIRIDVPLLKTLSRDIAGQIKGLEREIVDLAGHGFNLNSVPQLRRVLFSEQKLPVQGKTTSDLASTDADSLKALADLGHDLPAKILSHRTLTKLQGTYVDKLPKLVSPVTGRLHTSFNQTVTATGRLSSSKPNLQNIPVRTEIGQKIRRAFIPADNWLLLKADYSQIELRVLAHFCGDEELRRAYREDRDIHALVAAQVHQVPEDQVTAEMRRFAKTINFGVIYGMSAYGLASRLGITKEAAGRFIDAYFGNYPRVAEYQDNLLRDCRKQGFVTTLLGRRRYITGVRSWSTYKDRNKPEREAVNAQIQGSAADTLKTAMVSVHRRLQTEKFRSRLLLTVHDELVFETPPEEKDALVDLVKHEMENCLVLKVPLRVDLAVGRNWLDVEKVERKSK